MKRSLNYSAMNVRVGLLVCIGIALVTLVIFYPIRGISPFSQKIVVRGYYNDVGGLKRNAPVFLSGMEVGGVKAVNFRPAGSPTSLEVDVKLETKIRHLVRKDSVMKIVSRGLLGDKFIEITPGSQGQPEVNDGDILTAEQEKDMMADFAGIKDKLESVMAKAESLLAYAQSRDTSMGKFMTDPRLYDEMVATLREIRETSARLKETVTGPDTKQAINATAASVRKVAEKVETYVDKIDKVRFYLDLGLNKYEGSQFATLAGMRIVPNEDRYYAGGIEYFNVTNTATSEEQMGFGAQLGFRIMQSPLFFWGGMKRTFFAAGLDLRLLNERFGIEADTYRFERPTAQLDLAAKYRVFNVFSLQGGVDDALAGTPRYRGGLTVTYDDQDLTTILLKIKTGL